MTTRSLLFWVALFGGAELALQGHLRDHAALFHGGAWLAAAAAAIGAWRAAGVGRATYAFAGLVAAALSLGSLPEPTPDRLATFWEEHDDDRAVLTRVPEGERLEAFGERVVIDRRGFRKQDPPARDAFRIVVLGGSNTFGVPLPDEGEPWPQRLEARLAALGCARPVDVFNGGRTGRGVPAIVRGFDGLVASLEPDLLLVYPSPADLAGLALSRPSGIGLSEPLPPRASPLLARLERAWRTRPVARNYHEALAADPPQLDGDTLPLANAYRQLLLRARRRGLDVALSTASLAIDAASPEADVRRYEAIDPRTRHLVLANRAHDRLVKQVGASFRAVLPDPGEGLSGAGDEAFLDLFHLRDAGRERLATNLAEALRPLLAERPEAGCPPL